MFVFIQRPASRCGKGAKRRQGEILKEQVPLPVGTTMHPVSEEMVKEEEDEEEKVVVSCSGGASMVILRLWDVLYNDCQ